MAPAPNALEIQDAHLMNAIRRSDVGLVKRCLKEYPASIHQCDRDGNTALHLAITQGGHLEICQLLMGAGVKTEALNGNSQAALHLVITDFNSEDTKDLGGNRELARLLALKDPKLLEHLDLNGLTGLHRAALTGRVDLLSWMIELGAPMNTASLWGVTALHFAARSGNVEMIRCCIQAGADLGAITVAGESIEDAVYYSGKEEAIAYLTQVLKAFKEKNELDQLTQSLTAPDVSPEDSKSPKEKDKPPAKKPVSL